MKGWKEDQDGFYRSVRPVFDWTCECCGEATTSSSPVRFPSSRLYAFESIENPSFRAYLLSFGYCRSCHARWIKKDGFECKICQKWDSPSNYYGGEYLAEKKLCHGCNFWTEKLNIRDNPRVARINGTHYMIESDDPEPGWGSGHGGRRFNIQFHDGRTVQTRNLWCQGQVPEYFKIQLPDNAVFLPDDPDMKPPNWQGFVDRNNGSG